MTRTSKQTETQIVDQKIAAAFEARVLQERYQLISRAFIVLGPILSGIIIYQTNAAITSSRETKQAVQALEFRTAQGATEREQLRGGIMKLTDKVDALMTLATRVDAMTDRVRTIEQNQASVSAQFNDLRDRQSKLLESLQELRNELTLRANKPK